MIEKIKDNDIREFLNKNRFFLSEFENEEENLVVNELQICRGETRIDIAVINGLLHGFEIKSDSDTLERLPMQVTSYSKVFDTLTVIVGEDHIENIFKLIPDWWGVIKVESKSFIKLRKIRESKINSNNDSLALAQLLWKKEALELLKLYNLERGFKSKPKRVIWDKIANEIPIDYLRYYVRKALKSRSDWRGDLLQQ